MNLIGEIETARRFRRGQYRMLVTTIIGYTLFYFLRKNLSLAMPGLAAEMLLSSDATDRGGMVATPELGVVYFPQLRSRESEVGGRVLFVRPTGFDLEKVTRYLESSVLLIDAMGKIR